jgi:hypothetical protein
MTECNISGCGALAVNDNRCVDHFEHLCVHKHCLTGSKEMVLTCEENRQRGSVFCPDHHAYCDHIYSPNIVHTCDVEPQPHKRQVRRRVLDDDSQSSSSFCTKHEKHNVLCADCVKQASFLRFCIVSGCPDVVRRGFNSDAMCAWHDQKCSIEGCLHISLFNVNAFPSDEGFNNNRCARHRDILCQHSFLITNENGVSSFEACHNIKAEGISKFCEYHQICTSIPCSDDLCPDGYTKEEYKKNKQKRSLVEDLWQFCRKHDIINDEKKEEVVTEINTICLKLRETALKEVGLKEE